MDCTMSRFLVFLLVLISLGTSAQGQSIKIEDAGIAEVTVDPSTNTIALSERLTSGVSDTNPLTLAKIYVEGSTDEVKVYGTTPSTAIKIEPPDSNGDQLMKVTQVLDHDDTRWCSESTLVNGKCPVYILVTAGNSVPVPVTVTLYVEDYNDNLPILVNPDKCKDLVVVENTANDNVCKFEAADADRWVDRDGLTFALSAGDPFSLDNDGVLSVTDRTDYETRTVYSLTVEVQDSAKQPSGNPLNFIVRVEDQADEPPKWTFIEPVNFVEETIAVGTVITTVEAIDGDLGIGSAIRYEMTASNAADGAYFTCDHNNGSIIVAASLDTTELLDKRKSLNFQFTVRAVEVSSPYDSASATISMIIEDTDNRVVEIDKDSPSRSIVRAETFSGELSETRLSVVDRDTALENTIYTAKLTDLGGNPLPAPFASAIILSPNATSHSGRTEFSLSVANGNIDYDGSEEWRQPIEFQIFFEQTGVSPPALVIPFTFEVEDVNDEMPQWVFPDGQTFFSFRVVENTKENELVFTLNATDNDYGVDYSTLRYDFDSRKPSYLDIDQETGAVTVAGSIDYEILQYETVRVKVWDNPDDGSNQNMNYAVLNIYVDDLNDEAPTIDLNTSSVRIAEHSAKGIEIPVTITVGDKDATKDLECSLEVTNNNPTPPDVVKTWFSIDKNCNNGNPRITVVGEIDRELDEYGEEFAAYERIDLLITVKDLNTDDAYKPSKEAASVLFAIGIDDINDNPPEFDMEDGEFRVFENTTQTGETSQQRKVADIYVTDKDYDTRLTFEIIHDGMFSDWFELDRYSGVRNGRNVLRKKAGAVVDRESPLFSDPADPVVSVRIRVFDGANENLTDILVRVEDRNDEIPQWTPEPDKEYYMYEHNGLTECPAPPPETPLDVEIIAFDRDECSSFSNFGCITFKLEDGYGLTGGFEINTTRTVDRANEAHGLLYVAGCRIDRETTQEFSITINAYDDYIEGRPVQIGNNRVNHTIRIYIADINDNIPAFVEPLPESPRWSEDDAEDKGVIFFISDPDKGENGTIKASVTKVIYSHPAKPTEEWNQNEIPDGPFDIGETAANSTWFTLTTLSTYNFTDKYGVFTVTVMITDLGAPPLAQSKEYNVTVVDINNNDPVIDQAEELQGARFVCLEGEQIDNYHVRCLRNKTDPVPLFTASDLDDPLVGNGQPRLRISDASDALVKEYLSIREEDGALIWLKHWEFSEGGFNTFEVKLEAYDQGETEQRTSEVLEITLRMKSDVEQAPFFSQATLTAEKFEENEYGDVITFEEADDANNIPDDPDNDAIYYYIVGDGQDVLDHFELDPVSTTISVKTPLDREEKDFYEIVVLASNYPTSPGLITDPRNSSFLTIYVPVEDQNDEPPKFSVPNNIISAGISVSTVQDSILKTNYWINATDLDLYDQVTYRISSEIVPHDPSLQSVVANGAPFTISNNVTSGGADLQIKFTPQPAHRGYFSFNIQACDSLGCIDGHTGEVPCKIYIVTDEHFVKFLFNNNNTYVESRSSQIQSILTKAYGSICVIDKIELTKDESSGAEIASSTTVTAHFVNQAQDTPISKGIIENWPYNNPEAFDQMITELSAEGLRYDVDGRVEDNGTSSEQITIYALVAVCSVLFVSLLILGTSCYFKNRGMSRKVRALSAAGGTSNGMTTKEVLPNTNMFASNPTFEADEIDGKKFPDLDARSTTSGGSSLVGIEEQDDFKGHEDKDSPNFEEELNSSEDDEGLYGSVRNPAYEHEYQVPPSESTNNYDYASPATDITYIPSASQSYNPNGTVTRKNPLANMMIEADEEA